MENPRARKPYDPNLTWGVVTAAVTKAQTRDRGDSKPLNVKEMTSRMVVDEEKLISLQEEDSSLQKFKEAKGTETRKGYAVSY